ncbi:hypothetical protein BC628DRAFT_1424234 [Trametes gibbosa]|nr:hypothetical protein BC628DRAFT_1424234 [Trametes gibbosa]
MPPTTIVFPPPARSITISSLSTVSAPLPSHVLTAQTYNSSISQFTAISTATSSTEIPGTNYTATRFVVVISRVALPLVLISLCCGIYLTSRQRMRTCAPTSNTRAHHVSRSLVMADYIALNGLSSPPATHIPSYGHRRGMRSDSEMNFWQSCPVLNINHGAWQGSRPPTYCSEAHVPIQESSRETQMGSLSENVGVERCQSALSALTLETDFSQDGSCLSCAGDEKYDEFRVVPG